VSQNPGCRKIQGVASFEARVIQDQAVAFSQALHLYNHTFNGPHVFYVEKFWRYNVSEPGTRVVAALCMALWIFLSCVPGVSCRFTATAGNVEPWAWCTVRQQARVIGNRYLMTVLFRMLLGPLASLMGVQDCSSREGGWDPSLPCAHTLGVKYHPGHLHHAYTCTTLEAARSDGDEAI